MAKKFVSFRVQCKHRQEMKSTEEKNKSHSHFYYTAK
jgi:hypothetical protein